jgi:hypothetical protein
MLNLIYLFCSSLNDAVGTSKCIDFLQSTSTMSAMNFMQQTNRDETIGHKRFPLYSDTPAKYGLLACSFQLQFSLIQVVLPNGLLCRNATATNVSYSVRNCKQNTQIFTHANCSLSFLYVYSKIKRYKSPWKHCTMTWCFNHYLFIWLRPYIPLFWVICLAL